MVVIGLLAGTLTTACWVPQFIRTLKSRTAFAFSWTYLSSLSVGVVLWFTYGIAKADIAIYLANGLTLMMVLGLVVLKALEQHRLRRTVPTEEAVAPLATESPL